ncbi:MAG TPA: MaoC family dehydratase N-terminal domain-containing protein [Acidimicrobiales bacterium]|nr:MaoC family dehydratase N-terminal domain-containing protein [Acidimicrobiales bacterium]
MTDQATSETTETTLDVSDLDRYMGVPMRPGELKEPVALNDVRRWVQAMHYPNPLHYDERWAAEGRWGEIVAPQSFTVTCDTSHGASPAQVGRIPGSHLIFGGDDWWFFGPRVRPGDKLVCHRMPYDYKVADTRFAGPTCFQRGDTLYINQVGERVALQRSTAIRYRVQEAKEKDMFGVDGMSSPSSAAGDGEPEWTDDQLAELEERKLAFIDQIQALGHGRRLFSSVAAGDRLAENVLGPHSLASFATEWRAYPMTTWGATAKGPTTVRAEELGYTREMAGFEGDRRMERVNPELTDGAYYGPSRGHLQPRWARHVGMPRGYGYGASMGAWILDYVAAWAGEWGAITHSSAQYRNPALTGDATFLTGEVIDTRVERKRVHLAVVAVDMRNQDGAAMATATVEVELPAE